jgi:hypothetical protein
VPTAPVRQDVSLCVEVEPYDREFRIGRGDNPGAPIVTSLTGCDVHFDFISGRFEKSMISFYLIDLLLYLIIKIISSYP